MSGAMAKSFLDNIVANIDDDTPRLIFADWLMENGQDERAEFIRVQIERTRRPTWDPGQVSLRLREQELLKQHGENWLSELPVIEGARWQGFRRGIIAEVFFESFEAMRVNAHLCRTIAPVEAVNVSWPSQSEAEGSVAPIAELRELTLNGGSRPMPEEMAWLADSPQLSTLHTLNVLGLSAEDLSVLAASPHLTGLQRLRLVSNGLGNAGLRALTQASTLMGLEALDLSGPGYYEQYYDDPIINAAGMEYLAAWPGLARVRSLTLSGSDVSQPGLRALLHSPHASALKELSLRKGRLDGRAMAEFGDVVPGLLLETLDLGENILKEIGVANLESALCLRELKALRLDRCEIPLAGARRLANTPFMGELRILNVGHNHFGPAGLKALLERELSSLHTLRMRDNDLFDKGAKLLAESPASDFLLEVDLSQNDLGTAAAMALGESKHLHRLLILRLVDNDSIGDQAAATLTASPLAQRLAILELTEPPRARYRSPFDQIPF